MSSDTFGMIRLNGGQRPQVQCGQRHVVGRAVGRYGCRLSKYPSYIASSQPDQSLAQAPCPAGRPSDLPG